jgi:cell division protein FtsL
MTTSVDNGDLEAGGLSSSAPAPPATINHTRTLTGERVSLAARRDMHPNLLQRIMDTRTMRKAPWLLYVFIFLVATGVAVMCIRFRLGDDLTATIVAVLTCGLILSTGLCVWFSIRSRRQLTHSEALEAEKKKKKRRITVTLKAHYYGEESLADNPNSAGDTLVCPICLVDVVKGDRVVKLDCDHFFHVGCISSWIARKAQCPACRYNIPTVITSCSTSARTSPRTANSRTADTVPMSTTPMRESDNAAMNSESTTMRVPAPTSQST